MYDNQPYIKEVPIEVPGAISYTDFTKIYLNYTLIPEELELTRIHELSHIWLQHHIRGEAFEKKHKNINRHLLNIAMDYEIAKHIYDDEDEKILNRKNSLLFTSIKKSSTDKYPNCQYFEEYYFALLKDIKKQKNNSIDAENNIFKKDKKKNKGGKEKEKSVPQIIEEAKKKGKAHKKINTLQKHQQKLSEYHIKPSLASIIDSVAGRQKIVRIKSFRRPNRREHDSFFIKGEISKRKTPWITTYVDRSGSFDQTKTDKATKTLKKILEKYRGQINHDVLYFNDTLFIKDPLIGSGGTNHQIVVDEIMKSQSALSIIITDNDDGLEKIPAKLPRVIVIPIGCDTTILAKKLKVFEAGL